MAYTTIDDGSVYFQTLLYTGNETDDTALTNTGNSDLQPDWLWIKSTGSTQDHQIIDTSRGLTEALSSNRTDTNTFSDGVKSIQSDGFTLGVNTRYNQNSTGFVAWQWKANGGTATATGSESGNNPAYSTQANQTAGFSIITYTGTGANSSSVVPHGLGVTPQVMIVKRRDGTSNWVFESSQTHNARGMYLNLTDGSASSGTDVVNKDSTNLSFVEIDNNRRVNHDGETFVAYCFAPIQGYSKFGSYTGNGNTDGTFVYTGFKPAWVLIKETGATRNWTMADSKSQTAGNGGATNSHQANLDSSKDANERMDWLSNGFKLRTTSTTWNTSSGTYVYMAFAEHPFVSSEGVPTTAR